MKVIVLTLALVSLSCAAPQPRKIFHEHVDDFLKVISEEALDAIERIAEEYMKYDDFWKTVDYMTTNSFKDLVNEMESLPEFKAVVEFLENDNIDITYFLDLSHEALETISEVPRPEGELISGPGLNAYVTEITAAFPKDKLAALFDEKMDTDEGFRVAIENLRSSEWEEIYNALWTNEVFQAEIQTFKDNGIDIDVIYDEILAVFGQN